MVAQSSAKLNVEHEVQIPMDRDHSAICKFEGEEDEGYVAVYRQIRRMLMQKGAVVTPGGKFRYRFKRESC